MVSFQALHTSFFVCIILMVVWVNFCRGGGWVGGVEGRVVGRGEECVCMYVCVCVCVCVSVCR